MPLPSIDTLDEIFTAYFNSLKRQDYYKKKITDWVNYARQLVGTIPANDYTQNGLERTKIEKFNSLKKQFANTKKKPESAVLAWMTVLDSLDNELTQIKQIKYFKEQKFAVALRVACTVICDALKNTIEFETAIATKRLALVKANAEILRAEHSGYQTQSNLLEDRNKILLDLVKYCDHDAIIMATKEGLLDYFVKPEKNQFTQPIAFNSFIDEEAEIHPLIPWAYQANLPLFYIYRLKIGHWPENQNEWENWKAANLVPVEPSAVALSSSTTQILESLPRTKHPEPYIPHPDSDEENRSRSKQNYDNEIENEHDNGYESDSNTSEHGIYGKIKQ